MKEPSERMRGEVAGLMQACLLAGAMAGWCPGAKALDTALDVSQYAHTAWKVRDGFAKGTINAITQTPDGYLLLGTEFGLLRFDGVNAVPWEPPGGQLPSNYIRSLLTARDGTIWVGTLKGLASWKDGRLTRYPGFGEQVGIPALLEDHEGTVWASASAIPPPGKLCAIRNGNVQCYGDDGAFGFGIRGLFEDSRGNLWAGAKDGLWRWKPGPPKFFPFPGEPDAIRALGEDIDGALLFAWKGGLWRLIDGKAEAYSPLRSLHPFRAESMFRDRNGGLWIATHDKALLHVHQGRTDVFAQPDGLSGNYVWSFFEDREGNVWVSTTDGLDRFREFAVATFGAKQGLPVTYTGSVLADRDGSIWLGGGERLYRWRNGVFNTYDRRDGKINGTFPMALFQDARGKVWVSTHEKPGGAGYFENEHFIYSAIRAKTIFSFAEDKAGNLWMVDQDTGLFRLSAQNEVQQIPWQQLGHKDAGFALAVDPSGDGLWLGFFQGGVIHYTDGQIRKSYTAADGLGGGRVYGLRFGSRGTLWAATDAGLSRIRDGRIMTLTSKNGLPCDTVHWSKEDDDHFVWLDMPCGLVRIARSELDAWVAAVEKDKNAMPAIRTTVFDISDGMRGLANVGGYGSIVTKSTDGKLWLRGFDGVAVVDPRHLPFNKLPPPVRIEQIVADRKTYEVPAGAMGQVAMAEKRGNAGAEKNALPDGRATDGRATVGASGSLPLPALVRDLEIDYTALSLVAPEKIRFRTKLEGWDRDWQDVGNRRQAFYTGLGPKRYRFRVMACNNSGVWNEEGASLEFSVAPEYYQTWWFRVSGVGTFLLLVWALYQMRVRQVAREYNMHLEGRVSERTRIARELHDTLLQSFQGVLLSFQGGINLLPHRPEEAKKRLQGVIEDAEQAVTEGRDAVQGLRWSTIENNNLAQTLITLGEQLGGSGKDGESPLFDVQVEGETEDLQPILRDEVYRITGEAMRNAFRHAQAKRVEVEIHYDEAQLRVRIRDDGKGMDEQVVKEKGRAGHYGLHGMQERAKLVGGKLELWSKEGAGTEVELSVPAGIAYESAKSRNWAWFFGKETKETKVKKTDS